MAIVLQMLKAAGLLLSLFKTEDGPGLTFRAKVSILAFAALIALNAYLMLEYRTVYEKGVEHRWEASSKNVEIERLHEMVADLRLQLEAKDTSVTPFVPVKDSSYEPFPPTNPAPVTRKPPEAVIRERADNLTKKING